MSIRANIIKGEHKMAAKFYAKSPGNEGYIKNMEVI